MDIPKDDQGRPFDPPCYEYVEDPIKINMKYNGYPCSQYYHGACYNALIKLIINLDVDGVENILQGHKNLDKAILDVRCSCGEAHFCNRITRMTDCFGCDPLIIAVRLSIQVQEQEEMRKICRLLMQFGCNPNTVPSDGRSALDIITLEGDIDMMKTLVEGGAFITTTMQRITKLVSTGVNEDVSHEAFSLKPIEMLLCDEVLISVPDPLISSFYSCVILDQLAEKHPNFCDELTVIKDSVESLTYNYVDLCKNTWEAKVLITKDVVSSMNGKKIPLFEYGISCNMKHFCSHKFVQHIAQGLWYGDSYDGGGYVGLLERFIAPILINIVYPIIMVNKFCRRKEVNPYSISQVIVKEAQVPAVSFAVDVINHITLTALFIYCCFIEIYSVTLVEVILWSAIFARIVVEFDFARQQGYLNYLSQSESYIEIFVGFTLVFAGVAYFTDAVTTEHDLHLRMVLLNRYSYSFAASALLIKLSMMLKINKTLGPLTETIIRMTSDIVTFMTLAILVVLGFSFPLYTIAYQTYYANLHMGKTSISISSHYESFNHTLAYLGYSLFGYGDAFSASISYDEFGSFLANSIYFLYMVALVVLLMNLLVAILDTTYSAVFDNATREWMFGKVDQVVKYKSMQPFLFPSILYLYPFHILFLIGHKCFPDTPHDEEKLLSRSGKKELHAEFVNQNRKLHKNLKKMFLTTKLDERQAEENRKRWGAGLTFSQKKAHRLPNLGGINMFQSIINPEKRD